MPSSVVSFELSGFYSVNRHGAVNSLSGNNYLVWDLKSRVAKNYHALISRHANSRGIWDF